MRSEENREVDVDAEMPRDNRKVYVRGGSFWAAGGEVGSAPNVM